MKWTVYLLTGGLAGLLCFLLGGPWWLALGLGGLVVAGLEMAVRFLVGWFSVARGG